MEGLSVLIGLMLQLYGEVTMLPIDESKTCGPDRTLMTPRLDH